MNAEVREYLDHFRAQVSPGTWGQRRLCLQRFSYFLQNNRISLNRIKPFHLDLYAQELSLTVSNVHGEPIGSNRIQRHLHELRPFFRYLFDQQKLLNDPSVHLSQLPQPQRPPKFVPTYHQVIELMDLPDLSQPAGLRDRAMFEVAYGCGLRLSELHRLVLKDVDLESGVLVVLRGKGGRSRRLPLGRWASYYLQLYLRQARPRLLKGLYPDLWVSHRGKPYAQSQSLITRMAAYERRLDFPLSWHSLRHAFATHLLEGGASVRAVQQLLGHSKITTTEFYTRVRPAALKRAHRRCHPRG